MCGIFGMVAPEINRDQLEISTSAIRHRGPDDVGYVVGNGIALGHRRLSIIDLDGGHQPMFNEDRTKCVVFNGEIYNFMELREALLKKGHTFTTRSDTETIVHAYEEWGDRCVERLRGMFAFAIWDERERSLFLARDRLGIKPLFIAAHGKTFYFASEMKSILADPFFPRIMDETGLACYFSLSYIPAPLTIFRNIEKLLPGHTLTYCRGRKTIRQYWDVSFVPDRSRKESDLAEEMVERLSEGVKSHLMSDVPLGAFLSGGIDSSTGVALMSRFSDRAVNTFCIGFGGNTGRYLDERAFARLVAERYGAHHREHEVVPDLSTLLDTIVQAFDEPFADDSAIPSYFVCQMARQDVKVALSGLGGDEAFAGYERYLGIKLTGLYAGLPRFLRDAVVRPIVEGLPETPGGHYTINHMKRFVRSASLGAHRSYFGYLTILGDRIRDSFFSDPAVYHQHLEECRHIISRYFNKDGIAEKADSLGRAMYCDTKTYLPEDILAVTDRMSMMHSLEVRVPFLDHEFFEFCAAIPKEMKIKWFTKKYLLRRAVTHLLPKEVLSHRKQGFVGPMTTWLRNDLKSYVLQTATEGNLGKHGILNCQTVRRIFDEHFSGKEIHDTLIWSVLIFQKWFETYMEGGTMSGQPTEKSYPTLAA